jgi:uncharacterized membrane protein (Fun14 family)
MLSEPTLAAEQQSGFDMTSAAIGAGVGFVAGYALMKAFRGKNVDDGFSRA